MAAGAGGRADRGRAHRDQLQPGRPLVVVSHFDLQGAAEVERPGDRVGRAYPDLAPPDLRPIYLDHVPERVPDSGDELQLRNPAAGRAGRASGAAHVELLHRRGDFAGQCVRREPLRTVHVDAIGRPVEGCGHVVPGVLGQHTAGGEAVEARPVAEARAELRAVDDVQEWVGVARLGVGLAAEDGVGAVVFRRGVDPGGLREAATGQAQVGRGGDAGEVARAVERHGLDARLAGHGLERRVAGVGLQPGAVATAGAIGQRRAPPQRSVLERQRQERPAALEEGGHVWGREAAVEDAEVTEPPFERPIGGADVGAAVGAEPERRAGVHPVQVGRAEAIAGRRAVNVDREEAGRIAHHGQVMPRIRAEQAAVGHRGGGDVVYAGQHRQVVEGVGLERDVVPRIVAPVEDVPPEVVAVGLEPQAEGERPAAQVEVRRVGDADRVVGAVAADGQAGGAGLAGGGAAGSGAGPGVAAAREVTEGQVAVGGRAVAQRQVRQLAHGRLVEQGRAGQHRRQLELDLVHAGDGGVGGA